MGKAINILRHRKVHAPCIGDVETGRNDALLITVTVDPHRLAKTLKERLVRAQIVPVTPKQKVTKSRHRPVRKRRASKLTAKSI